MGLWRLLHADIIPSSQPGLWSDIKCFAFGSLIAEMICEFHPEAENDDFRFSVLARG